MDITATRIMADWNNFIHRVGEFFENKNLLSTFVAILTIKALVTEGHNVKKAFLRCYFV